MAVNDHEFAIAGTTRSYGGDGRQFWLLKYAYLPHIGTDRASLNFSGVHIGDSATRTLNIINTGAVDLTVTGIITPPEFSFAGQFPVVLEPSDSVAVDIIFAPTTVGPHIDTLFVESYAVTGPHPVRLLGTGIATDAQDNAHLLPEALALAPAFPNPFNASTTLRFALPEMTDIKLTALNLTGQEVAMLAEGAYAGSHSVQWNAAGVPSGVYFVRLQTPRETLTQKILLLK